MAIIIGEPGSDAVAEIADRAEQLVIAAPTLTEALIVAAGRGLSRALDNLLGDLNLVIIPFDETRAPAAAAAYRIWGKGFAPAALNFGDCFAYALAKELSAPLLFVGNDFTQTDVTPALPPAA